MNTSAINFSSNEQAETKSKNSTAFFALIILFFIWGFMTVLNDILIPHLKSKFSLSFFQSMLVQTAFFGSYFIGSIVYYLISVTKGDPINKFGYKSGILVGLLLSATGSFMFYPAAIFHTYALYLLALSILGLGFTMLQITANPYVAILGSNKTASSRLNLAQAFNSLGTMLSPLIGGMLIFNYFAGSDAVKIPYAVLGAVLMLTAVFFKFIQLPTFQNEQVIERGGVLKFRHLRLGMIAVFAYVGAEVAVGSLLINFFSLPKIAGLNHDQASGFLSFYWGGLMIGRFLGSISMSDYPLNKKLLLMGMASLAGLSLLYFSNNLKGYTSIADFFPMIGYTAVAYIFFIIGRGIPNRTLYIFSAINIVLLTITVSASGSFAFWAVLAIGLFNSIMWSNIFTLSINGLGKFTSQGSSLLVMMILGGAIVPPIQGYVADIFNVQLSFLIPLLCYGYVFYYGLSGYKIADSKDRLFST